MYLTNKYTRWYYSIIDNANSRTLHNTVYIEKHHIIPRSMGGNNDVTNLAKLTAREHYLCHYLLTKMTTETNKVKMLCALRFLNANNRKSSRVYEYIKTNLHHGPLAVLIKQKISNTMKGRPAHNKGKKQNHKKHQTRIDNSATGLNKLKGVPRPRLCCIHCHTEVDLANLSRYHQHQ